MPSASASWESSKGAALPGATARPGRSSAVQDLERMGLPREEALRVMTQEYVTRMHSNEPVHTWSSV